MTTNVYHTSGSGEYHKAGKVYRLSQLLGLHPFKFLFTELTKHDVRTSSHIGLGQRPGLEYPLVHRTSGRTQALTTVPTYLFRKELQYRPYVVEAHEACLLAVGYIIPLRVKLRRAWGHATSPDIKTCHAVQLAVPSRLGVRLLEIRSRRESPFILNASHIAAVGVWVCTDESAVW